ncbi:CheR family methyltransferase, partial [Arthrospira platensis SPKY1]|nr:CheR family methyltransferase [Arthrospira platensis SPKY1]
DTEAYASLATQAVDALVSSRADGQTIRVWCAGCSTGEEPYSIAMLFMEAFDQIKRWPSLKIFATDVDKANIEVAAAGSYPESIAAEVTPARLERFFVRHGNRFVVRPEL